MTARANHAIAADGGAAGTSHRIEEPVSAAPILAPPSGALVRHHSGLGGSA
jgi:hypothetical protein